MIEVVNLTKSFKNVDVLKGINVTINKGEKIVVLGPSGSGKSTFLRCLNCMEDPTSGSIIFNGVDIADMSVNINVHRQKMGMVFQHFNLFNNKTVIDNIMLAPIYVEKKRMRKLRFSNPNGEEIKSTKQIKAEAKENAMKLLKRIGLEEKADVFPSQLSGGQKQRTSIARALIKNSSILILDDSLSAVDTDTEENILNNLKESRKDKTTIIIAHRISTIMNAHHILVLDEGKTIEYGTFNELMALNGVFKEMYDKQQLEKQLNEGGSENG